MYARVSITAVPLNPPAFAGINERLGNPVGPSTFLLLVDGVSFLLLVDGASLLQLVGGDAPTATAYDANVSVVAIPAF